MCQLFPPKCFALRLATSISPGERYPPATLEEMEEAVEKLPQGTGQVLEFKRKQA